MSTSRSDIINLRERFFHERGECSRDPETCPACKEEGENGN